MSILETINASKDIKKLRDDQLEPLCAEIREFLIGHIAKTGGHLASNLGAVELTVALHRVYDSSRDRLLFDVGHQIYTHKLITGRRDRFESLRQYRGLSGFPKPYESGDDPFVAGHASDSVSVALGMAKARTMAGEKYGVVAILGDGALTGGLAYEGLSAAAASGEPIVVILNDNNMSIDPNVGGTASLLQRMRVRPGYISFKRWYRSALSGLPGVYKFTHALKERLKARLLPDNMFSAMGFDYLGPVDGHNVANLETAIRWAREMEKPVLLHVLTEKGKGCSYAEEHPELYHGVGPFDPVSGEIQPVGECFSDVFGRTMCELAEKDGRIAAVTAAMASGTGLEAFAQQFPDRFIDAGIAEGHATAMAAGMAKQGAVPVFAVYSTFMQRSYDMLIHDVALQQLHVVFGVDRAGIVGSDGETHHGIFDVAYLSSVPGMTVLCPASFSELRDMLKKAVLETEGPVAVRYPRGGEGEYRQSILEAERVLLEGKDITIVCYGTMINTALEAARELHKAGISAEVIKLGEINANSFEQTLASLKKTGRFIAAEEVCAAGCVGKRVLAAATVAEIHVRGSRLLNLDGGIVPHGDRASLMRDYGIDAESVVRAAKTLCGKTGDNEKTQT